MSQSHEAAVTLIMRIIQVTVIQSCCNSDSDDAMAQTFLLVHISVWPSGLTRCCKGSVTETKSFHTSYLSSRCGNHCGPNHGSTIILAAAIYVTSFTCHKSALYTYKHSVVSYDISIQGLTSLCLSRKKQEETWLIIDFILCVSKGSDYVRPTGQSWFIDYSTIVAPL